MCVHIKVILDQKQKSFCNLPPLSKCCDSNSMTKPIWLFQFPFLGSCPLSTACKISMISSPRTRYVISVSVQCSNQFRLKKSHHHSERYAQQILFHRNSASDYNCPRCGGQTLGKKNVLPYSPKITVTQESQHSTSTIPLHITQPPPPPLQKLIPTESISEKPITLTMSNKSFSLHE